MRFIFPPPLVALTLAALLWQFTRAVVPLQSWQMLLAGAAAALLLPLLETTVEGIALRNPETWALRLTGIAQAIDVIFRPVGALMLAFSNSPSQPGHQMGTVTDDELKTWVEVGQPDGGSLDQGERQMIYSIFRFGDTLCREVMVPRIEVLARPICPRRLQG